MYVLIMYLISTLVLLDTIARLDRPHMVRLLDNVIGTELNNEITPIVASSDPLDVSIGLGISGILDLQIATVLDPTWTLEWAPCILWVVAPSDVDFFPDDLLRNTQEQVLHLRGYLRMTWVNPLLQWNPEEYGNITSVVLPQKYVWRPDIAFLNSLKADIYAGSSSVLVRVDSTGQVEWLPPFLSTFPCQVDVIKFPMDDNLCPIRVGTWIQSNETIKLSIMDPHTLITQREHRVNAIFHVDVEESSIVNIFLDGSYYEYYTFQIGMKRMPQYSMLSLLLPVIVIGLLNPLTFLIPPDVDEKVGASLSVLLATSVCIGSIRHDLPDKSEPLSSLVVYVVGTFVSAFLGVFGNIIVLLCHRVVARGQLGLSSAVSVMATNQRSSSGREVNNLRVPGHAQTNPSVKTQSVNPKDKDNDAEDNHTPKSETPATGRSGDVAKKLNEVFFAVAIFLYVANLGAVLFAIIY